MNKKITIIKTKVNEALQLSEELIVQDESSLSGAIDFLSRIKSTGNSIKEAKEKITKPLNEALKNARDMFRPVENNYLQAERNVKAKILDYDLKQEKKKEKQLEKIADKVENGKMKIETAMKKVEEMPEVIKRGKDGVIQYRIIKKIVIINESKIPRKYFVVDKGKVRKDMLAGISISGIELREEKIIAV